MNIIIKAKNLELTESMRILVAKKMKGLEKFIDALGQDKPLFVEIDKETKHHRKGDLFRAEAMVKVSKDSLMSQGRAEDLASALVKVRQEMERNIRKHKTKTIDLPRRQYRKVKKEII